MATLYRKYRPQSFSELFGQNGIKLTLENEIKLGKIAHAYLFCGPRAVGKTTIARLMAKSVNCQNRREDSCEPCNECDNCKDITIGRNMDIIEIDAASHTGVDNVRENIIVAARVAPSKLKYKVFIIDEVHMLSTSAFNALLKVMEEPPENVIFILCTTEIHKVPATIISRCQRFDFKRLSISDEIKKLQFIVKKEGVEIDEKILEEIARHSEGHMRDAESLLGQIIAIGGNNITEEEASLVIPRSDLNEVVNLIDFLSQNDAKSGISLVNKIVDEGVDLKRFLMDLIELLRRIMMAKINPALADKLARDFGESVNTKIDDVSKKLNAGQIVRFIEKFLETKNSLKNSFIIQLPLEMAVVDLCGNAAPVSAPVVEQVNRNNTFTPAPPQIKKEPIARPAEEKISSAPIASAQVDSKNLVDIDIETVKLRWPEVMDEVKRNNHSLTFVLKACFPEEVKASKICLVFKYKFHRDRVCDVNVKLGLENILHKVYGTPITIESVIREDLKVEENSQTQAQAEVEKKESAPEAVSGDLMNNLLKTFGGKIVG